MEHQNQSPESPRPNRRQFLFTTGSTIAAGLIAHPGRHSLPTDRPPKQGTRKYYRVGWKLLENTTMAGRRLDHISPRSQWDAPRPTPTMPYVPFGDC
jgi:hypothetical protein